MCISLNVFVTRSYDVMIKFSCSFIGLCRKKTLRITDATDNMCSKYLKTDMISLFHLKCGSEKWILALRFYYPVIVFIFFFKFFFFDSAIIFFYSLFWAHRVFFAWLLNWPSFYFHWNIENVKCYKMRKKADAFDRSNVSKMARKNNFFMDSNWIFMLVYQ